MMTSLPIVRLSRTTALAATVACFACVAAAYADDDSDNHDAVIRESALSAQARTAASSPALDNQAARLASTVPMAQGTADVLGAGGHQDELAREIYRPGFTPSSGN